MRPADPALADWCGLYCAEYAVDSGNVIDADALMARIRAERVPSTVVRWSAFANRELAGVAALSPSAGAGFLRLYVPASRRRQAIGTALLHSAREHGTGAAIRTVVTAGGPGERFAEAVGARPVMRLVVMSQSLAQSDPYPLWLANGYRLVLWHDGAPDELLTSYASAKRHIIDAPDAHLQVDGAWDAAGVREWERSIRAEGRTLWVAAAVANDVVAAFTEIETGPTHDASQVDTVVLPGHRGAGLARAVKTALAAHIRAHRPDLTTVTTNVNADNEAMMRVNRRLGYREVRRRLLVELPGRSPSTP